MTHIVTSLSFVPSECDNIFFLLNIKVLYDKRDSAYRKSKLLVRSLTSTAI